MYYVKIVKPIAHPANPKKTWKAGQTLVVDKAMKEYLKKKEAIEDKYQKKELKSK